MYLRYSIVFDNIILYKFDKYYNTLHELNLEKKK